MPCLVQGTRALPAPAAMKPKRRRTTTYSLKPLVKALHRMKMKKTPCDDGRAPPMPKIGSKSPPGAQGGGVKGVVKASGCGKAAAPRRAAGHRKGVVRVKVVLTKEEAAALLSLTVGGQNTAAQIVAEIKRMEARRAAANGSWRPALESIPEESS